MKRIHYAAVRNIARENIVTVQVAKLAASQKAGNNDKQTLTSVRPVR